jgi:hypothetical protein
MCGHSLWKEPPALNLLRFEDLRDKRIVRTWNTFNNWIDTRGFPPGRMIGRFRTWTEAEVMAWIERQPHDKLEPRGAVKRRAAP